MGSYHADSTPARVGTKDQRVSWNSSSQISSSLEPLYSFSGVCKYSVCACVFGCMQRLDEDVWCPNPSLFTMSIWDSVSHWTCSQAGGQETWVTSLPPLTIIVWLGMHDHAQIFFFNVVSRGSWTPVNCHKLPHSPNLVIKVRMLCHSWVTAPGSW